MTLNEAIEEATQATAHAFDVLYSTWTTTKGNADSDKDALLIFQDLIAVNRKLVNLKRKDQNHVGKELHP